MTDFEAARQAQIEKNRARLRELGLLETVREINNSMVQERQQNRQHRAAKQAVAAAPRPPQRVRRSERVQGKEPTNYNERALAKLGLDEEDDNGRRPRLLRENTTEEVYTFEQVKLLGSAAQPWELFVDGYDASGERIYDKVNGQTCHQCRQKTLGKRTACSCCESLRGVFCGDCLYMRYGENVDEVNANPEWVCPVCRGLCNCSFHRIKKGWAPTGTLYRTCMREGFQSVAHYLVLTNLREEDRPLAAHLMPKGWEYDTPAAAEGAQAAGSAAAAAAGPSGAGAEGATAVEDHLLSLSPLEAPAAVEPDGQQPAASGGGSQEAAVAEGGEGRRSRRGQRAGEATAAEARNASRDEKAREPARRSGRNAGRQATLEEVARAPKRKAAEPPTGATPGPSKLAAADKGKGVSSARRGLRSLITSVVSIFTT